MLARGKLELSSSLQVTFTEVKCTIRMMNVNQSITTFISERLQQPIKITHENKMAQEKEYATKTQNVETCKLRITVHGCTT